MAEDFESVLPLVSDDGQQIVRGLDASGKRRLAVARARLTKDGDRLLSNHALFFCGSLRRL